jgi:hypothetical protein
MAVDNVLANPKLSGDESDRCVAPQLSINLRAPFMPANPTPAPHRIPSNPELLSDPSIDIGVAR